MKKVVYFEVIRIDYIWTRMDVITRLPIISRVLLVTDKSARNVDNWDSACNLTFLAREIVKRIHIDLVDEYYCVFEDDLCLDLLFQ